MAKAIDDTNITPADELRGLLVLSEKRAANVPGSGAAMRALLRDMDHIARLWPQLEAQGVDLRAEEGRWDTLQATVTRHAPAILAELRTVGGLAAARSAEHGAAPAAWWWRLDDKVRADRVRRLRTLALWTVGLVALALLVRTLLGVFLPVDPLVSAALLRQNAGEDKVTKGDIAGAVADFEAATAIRPTDAELWLWLGVSREALRDPAGAQAAFEQARAAAGNELGFRQGRLAVYLSFGAYDKAKTEADVALKLDPENPYTLYYLATVYEVQDRLSDAIKVLQQASEYAEARNQVEIGAMSRFRMGMVMQQMQSRPMFGGTSTPTPNP